MLGNQVGCCFWFLGKATRGFETPRYGVWVQYRTVASFAAGGPSPALIPCVIGG